MLQCIWYSFVCFQLADFNFLAILMTHFSIENMHVLHVYLMSALYLNTCFLSYSSPSFWILYHTVVIHSCTYYSYPSPTIWMLVNDHLHMHWMRVIRSNSTTLKCFTIPYTFQSHKISPFSCRELYPRHSRTLKLYKYKSC